MKVIRDLTQYDGAACAVTLGKFDGLHLGHQQLLRRIIELSQQEQNHSTNSKPLQTVVFTFDQSPNQLFSNASTALLMTEKEKLTFLEQYGIDVCILFPFTKDTAAIEPEDFIQSILIDSLHAKKIVIGPDYRFGSHRRGDADMLRLYSKQYGYELEVIEKLQYLDEPISSTRISVAIRNGNIHDAEEMLGRPYKKQ